MTVIRNAHSYAAAALAAELKTSLGLGLTPHEAQARLERDGPNELEEEPSPSLWQRLLGQLGNLLVLILIAAAVISFAIGEATDGMVILAIIALNATLGVIQERRAERTLEALRRLSAPTAMALRQGQLQQVPARSLVVGDLVQLEAGGIVPVDLRLVESQHLELQEASLTGESLSVSKTAADTLPAETPLGERLNMAFMGTTAVAGRGRGLVVATGMDTEMGHIAGLLRMTADEQTPLQRRLESLAKQLGLASLGVGALVLLLGLARGEPALGIFFVAVSLAVAAIPEGLPAVVTIVLALGTQRMARRRAIVRHLPAVETLGSATVICTDKTGTLTRNEMTAVAVYLPHRRLELDEETKQGSPFRWQGQPWHPDRDPSLTRLCQVAALCNNSALDQEGGLSLEASRALGDPTEVALAMMAAQAGFSRDEQEAQSPRRAELPFDSDRKLMTTLHDVGEGNLIAYTKRAPEEVLARSRSLLSQGRVDPLSDDGRRQAEEANQGFAAKGYRVLGLAFREVPAIQPHHEAAEVEKDLVFVGLVAIADPPRPGVEEAIALCQRAGIRPVMITGDHEATARAIAEELGILRTGGGVLSARDLEALDEDRLVQLAPEVSVYARVSPEHKVRIVSALKGAGGVVAMTGDGVNDAPALRRADIGVAMGQAGTDVAREASDLVLADDNFATIVAAVEEGRAIYDNIRKFVLYLVSCNIGEVLVILVAMLAGLPLPLLATQILLVNLITDGLPALALGVEKGDRDVMERPPRPPKEPIIDRAMAGRIAFQGILIAAVTLTAYLLAWRSTNDVDLARSVALTTLILAELARAYSVRSLRRPIWQIDPFSNPALLGASFLSVAVVLAVLYLPPLSSLFHVIPLTPSHWVAILPLALLPWAAAEAAKVYQHRTSSPH